VLVNKADGAPQPAAEAHARELESALSLLRPGVAPHVSALSAVSLRGVPELWAWLLQRLGDLRQRGELAARREAQLARAFSAAVFDELRARAASDPRAQQLWPRLEAAVRAGQVLPTAAARELATAVLGR
jgi:LAO/AO transport system kinase